MLTQNENTGPRFRYVKADYSDTESLYKLLRGTLSQDALNLHDAFVDEDWDKALSLIQDLKGKYDSKHSETLTADPSQDSRSQRTHRAAIPLFDKITAHLQWRTTHKAASKEKIDEQAENLSSTSLSRFTVHEKDLAPGAENSKTDIQSANSSIISRELPEKLVTAYAAATTLEEQTAVLKEFFEFNQVLSADQVLPDSYCLIARSNVNYFLRVSSENPVSDPVKLRVALTNRPVSAQPLDTLLEFGKKGKLFTLSLLDNTGDSDPDMVPFDHDKHLNPSVFGVLMHALRDSKIFPDYAGIGHIRDTEYKKGKYYKTQQSMASKAQAFEGAAAQRQAANSAFERRVKAGTEKISIAALEARRAEDKRIDLIVTRARQKFAEIAGGLGVIINLSGVRAPGDEAEHE